MIYSLFDAISDVLKWLFATKKERGYMSLPANCRYCEVLGMCRDEDHNWKCRNGCIIINQRNNADE